jgi:ribosomal protein L36
VTKKGRKKGGNSEKSDGKTHDQYAFIRRNGRLYVNATERKGGKRARRVTKVTERKMGKMYLLEHARLNLKAT